MCDLEFLDLLGLLLKVVEFVKMNVYEGGVWYFDKNEFYFIFGRLMGFNGNVRVDVSFCSDFFVLIFVIKEIRMVMMSL